MAKERRELRVVAQEAAEPVDVEAFCDAYARALIAEVEAEQTSQRGKPVAA